MTPEQIGASVRAVPDFPSPGITFRDIGPLLAHPEGFAASVDWLAERVTQSGATKVAGMEARGFIFGAAVARQCNLGFIPIRKPGKIPVETIATAYDLEYGSNTLELDPTLLNDGEAVAIVDDLIATGGTAVAARDLLHRAGARVNFRGFVIELTELGGRRHLETMETQVVSLLGF